MSELTIRPARTARERRRFIDLARPIYAADPCWVPPLLADLVPFLDPRRGVFFDGGEAELLVAWRGDRPVGRISAQVSRRHLAQYADGKGFFGFFECEDDPATARALFAAGEAWLRAQGCTQVEGPYGFGIYDEIGLLVDGFDSAPYVMNIHNPRYYEALVEGAGYRKAVDWYAYRITAEAASQRWPARLKQLRDRVVRRQGLTLRNPDMRHFRDEAALVKKLFNSAWSPNYGHLPLTDREFDRLAAGLRRLIIPELTFIAEVGGKPVGFALSVYDVNPLVRQIDGRLWPFGWYTLLRGIKRQRHFRLLLMGVIEAHQGRGYEIVFSTEVAERGLRAGFTECELSNVVETNEPMLRSASHLPAERYKTYRIYRKELS